MSWTDAAPARMIGSGVAGGRRTSNQMPKKSPEPHELEAIETASEDELRSVQLERLRWSLQHAYAHIAHD